MFCIINSQDNKWKINEKYIVYDACGVMFADDLKKKKRSILFGMIVNHQFS